MLIRVVENVRFHDSKGFPLLLVDVEKVLMRAVGAVRFRDSKKFPLLLKAGFERIPMTEDDGNEPARGLMGCG